MATSEISPEDFAKLELAKLHDACKKKGLSSWKLLEICLVFCMMLYQKADNEFWLNVKR